MCNCCQIVSENIKLKNENDILKNRIKELEGNNNKRRLRRSSSIDLREKYRKL
ncbi:MAG: hypothetical protein E6936_10435 [Clostridium perfringens]|uniref:hypothetical protein n=1 Tax=Clostridium perfringens TaxID=1502 RepID=UPI0024BC55D4|nr:hypothetical protein [Clostridium perfringens]MDK0576550.1 hypothetical protein [Clostridium perfringens]MDK0579493.1 hypothetical protein [Clostridium perfringens]MDU1307867.1 hypothetical protein [Clostridium perfringens]